MQHAACIKARASIVVFAKLYKERAKQVWVVDEWISKTLGSNSLQHSAKHRCFLVNSVWTIKIVKRNFRNSRLQELVSAVILITLNDLDHVLILCLRQWFLHHTLLIRTLGCTSATLNSIGPGKP